MNRPGSLIFFICLSALLFFTSGVLAATQYQIIDLGVLPGGDASMASGLNDYGQTAGSSSTDSADHAFSWTAGGGLQDLGQLPGGQAGSWGHDVNNSGQVAGHSWIAPGDVTGVRAFIYENGSVTNLGTLPIGGYGSFISVATSINNSGQVAGYSDTGGCLIGENCPAIEIHSFLWDATNGMQDILGNEPLVTESYAHDINDSGAVAGYFTNASYETPYAHAYYWNGTMTDIGVLSGGSYSFAYGINGSSRVVGVSDTVVNSITENYAFLWDSVNGMMSLGSLGGSGYSSEARAINDLNQVVGTSGSGSGNRAVIWDSTNGMQDLNDFITDGSGWVLQTADDINSGGQIVGTGTINGQTHGFILTPTATLVPEPASVVLFLFGGSFLAYRTCRRRNK